MEGPLGACRGGPVSGVPLGERLAGANPASGWLWPAMTSRGFRIVLKQRMARATKRWAKYESERQRESFELWGREGNIMVRVGRLDQLLLVQGVGSDPALLMQCTWIF